MKKIILFSLLGILYLGLLSNKVNAQYLMKHDYPPPSGFSNSILYDNNTRVGIGAGTSPGALFHIKRGSLTDVPFFKIEQADAYGEGPDISFFVIENGVPYGIRQSSTNFYNLFESPVQIGKGVFSNFESFTNSQSLSLLDPVEYFSCVYFFVS